MDNEIWHRRVIKCLHKKGLAPLDIHADMVLTYGDTAPFYTTVKRWAAHFKVGNESLENDDRCGRMKKATTEENIAHAHRVVLDDRSLTVNQIASTVGISRELAE